MLQWILRTRCIGTVDVLGRLCEWMSLHAGWHAAGKDGPAREGRSSVASDFKIE